MVSTLSPTASPVTQLDEILALIGTTLEITATQRSAAEQHYLAIARWLGGVEGAPFRLYEPQIYPQGSLRLGTTVKPLSNGEYDLDLVYELQVDYTHIPKPVALIDMLYDRLRDHGTYRDMVERKNRCVRVNYEGQFHLDILPAALDRACGGTCVRVPDCSTQGWKPSNPKGYAAYFDARAATVEFAERSFKASVEPLPDHVPHEAKTSLQREVQLIKRLRDITFADNCDLAPISIVLTTLAANNFSGERSVALVIGQTFDSIVAQIPTRGRLYVFNPSNPEEDLSERWDKCPEAYLAFCEAMRRWQRAWNALLELRGVDRVVAELERMFGPAPVRKAIDEQIRVLEKSRRQGRLGVDGAGVVVTTAVTAVHTPVPKNTFYGG
ncbi:MAG: hypothetical protein AUG51_21665 [Acidobacteria bacterium 13_1_20CM_3_53_8]|nr:MAG: hypothetical protein AUG51_21665 [Acidobacteria bacterium 13_1_20CM_3_53_8]